MRFFGDWRGGIVGIRLQARVLGSNPFFRYRRPNSRIRKPSARPVCPPQKPRKGIAATLLYGSSHGCRNLRRRSKIRRGAQTSRTYPNRQAVSHQSLPVDAGVLCSCIVGIPIPFQQGLECEFYTAVHCLCHVRGSSCCPRICSSVLPSLLQDQTFLLWKTWRRKTRDSRPKENGSAA